MVFQTVYVIGKSSKKSIVQECFYIYIYCTLKEMHLFKNSLFTIHFYKNQVSCANVKKKKKEILYVIIVFTNNLCRKIYKHLCKTAMNNLGKDLIICRRIE